LNQLSPIRGKSKGRRKEKETLGDITILFPSSGRQKGERARRRGGREEGPRVDLLFLFSTHS